MKLSDITLDRSFLQKESLLIKMINSQEVFFVNNMGNIMSRAIIDHFPVHYVVKKLGRINFTNSL